MGTHFTAVVNHNLDERHIYDLPDLLNRMWPKVEPLLPIMEGYPAPGFPPSQWKWSERYGVFSVRKLWNDDTAMLENYEFNGFASKHVFRVSHAVRWSTFLEDRTTRSKLRQVCQHIASVLGGNQIVYLPSGFLKPEAAIGLMYEGKTVEDMIEWLIENCGPPAQSVDSFDFEELDKRYYIEKI
jgi:hypothetical protein